MPQLFAVQHAWLIPLLPLIGAALAGLLGAKFLRGQSHWPIWLGVGASAVISLSLLFGMMGLPHGQNLAVDAHWYTWIQAGSFQAEAGAWIDPLTAVMLCVVTGVGFLIIVFAKGYMAGETGYFRFFAYLGLFIFAMTILVLADNFVMLYLGWEGVGLCSYLLIGYYYDRPAAREAAKKAFLVNRVGDFGFGLGIMLIFKAFGTVSFFGDTAHPGVLIQALHPATAAQVEALRYIPFLLMLGAFGKSAQFPLYVWLPDAMEGPTPVSALIHAATMVTAGVYMIARCSTLFVQNEAAMLTIACVGVFTALFAATIALRQWDLKKVFAYSTISQLGYMFAALGVLAPAAAVFHLLTHAFFKALLFLCCGVVMHAMAGELDMRKMSGLKRILPWTNRFILVGCLALSGFPLLSGFFSKDDIVAAALDRHILLGLALLLTSFLTAYYTFRLYFQVFQGPLVVPEPSQDAHDQHHGQDHEHSHNHEPAIMMLPLAILALGAILIGYVNWPSRTGDLSSFLGQSPSLSLGYKLAPSDVDAEAFGQAALKPAAVGSPVTPMMLLGAAISIAGILAAYWLHLKDRPRAQRVADAFQPLTDAIEHKYWVDEIYQAAIVEPLRKLGSVFFAIDEFIIDGIVAVIGFIPQLGGFALKFSTQRGYLQGYAATMLIGILAILVLIFVF